ncbi:expressed unknown protein [Ectocarpus siliculosus]|uniref:Uncharacterized protein n=1 Tax=Ectocarpus siliculosus TaxID=2880 RepID=D7FPI1_ECTSI|nr:expressed unknown protein [Ectocarpus siliculosus]|eukprot:CBJ30438.1 expressed unknown protein [Ectocarpus siliculosus]
MSGIDAERAERPCTTPVLKRAWSGAARNGLRRPSVAAETRVCVRRCLLGTLRKGMLTGRDPRLPSAIQLCGKHFFGSTYFWGDWV